MGSKTDAFETDFLEHIFQNAAIANIGDASGLPASATEDSLYIALFTTSPTDSTAGTEAAYTGYARIAVARNSSNWTVAGNNASNTNAITFPEATAGSETENGFGILTAITGGDLLFYGDLDSPLAVSVGITPNIPAGDLDINED